MPGWQFFYLLAFMAGQNLNNNANMQNKNYSDFNLKVGSYNIRGQGTKNEVKLRKVKNLFCRGNFDILLLQETRSLGDEKEIKKWQKIFNMKQIF